MNLSTIPNINPIGKATPRDKKLLTHLLYHKNMVETIERFKWKDLPNELPSDLIERIIFFRGKGALFVGTDGKYKFLPFALSSEQGIDVYGRYVAIQPQLFTGTNKDEENYNMDMPLRVAYSKDDLEGEAVILYNSTLEIAQDNIPLAVSMSPLHEQMVEILVLVNIDLVSSAKVFTLVAKDEAQKHAIEAEFEGLDERILDGKRVVVLTSDIALQELAKTDSRDSNRYMQVYQSFDNLRKDILGITNAGTFSKNSIQTDSEVSQNSNSSSVMENALRMRKEFCDIANAVFGLNISVECQKVVEPSILGNSSNNSDRNEGFMEEDE